MISCQLLTSRIMSRKSRIKDNEACMCSRLTVIGIDSLRVHLPTTAVSRPTKHEPLLGVCGQDGAQDRAKEVLFGDFRTSIPPFQARRVGRVWRCRVSDLWQDTLRLELSGLGRLLVHPLDIGQFVVECVNDG